MRNQLDCFTFWWRVLGSPLWFYIVGNRDKLENSTSWNSPRRILFLVSCGAGNGDMEFGNHYFFDRPHNQKCTVQSYIKITAVLIPLSVLIFVLFQNIIYFLSTISLGYYLSVLFLNVSVCCFFWVPFKPEGLLKIPSPIPYRLQLHWKTRWQER